MISFITLGYVFPLSDFEIFLLQDKRKFVKQTFFFHLLSFLPCRRLVSPSSTTFPSALHRLFASFLQLKSTFTLTLLRMTCSFHLSSTFPFSMILLHILLQLIFSLVLDGLLVFHRRGFTLTNSQHGSTRLIVLFLSFTKMPAMTRRFCVQTSRMCLLTIALLELVTESYDEPELIAKVYMTCLALL